MAIAFKSTKVHFDATSGGKQTEPGRVTFPTRVRTAEAALKGFQIGYTERDRWIMRQEVDVDNIRIDGATVEFDVDLLIRDASTDNIFDGIVEVLVIADLF